MRASTATSCTAPRWCWQILGLLASGNPAAKLIRDKLTVVVIPMYNPDGAEANIRQSTTPTRIDLNRDWENFAQPESVAFWKLWRTVAPDLALDLHHMGEAPVVNGTDDLNQFQIGARSIDPSRMTTQQWLTNRQMAMVSVDALERYGLANIAHYPLIDITNAALSGMLMGGTAPAGESPVSQAQTPTQGAIFYEVRSVGQATANSRTCSESRRWRCSPRPRMARSVRTTCPDTPACPSPPRAPVESDLAGHPARVAASWSPLVDGETDRSQRLCSSRSWLIGWCPVAAEGESSSVTPPRMGHTRRRRRRLIHDSTDTRAVRLGRDRNV